MRQSLGIDSVPIRTLFVSDLHLGSRYCQAAALEGLISRVQASTIYLVGDVLDGWLLRRRWLWTADYRRLFDTLNENAASGVEIHYLLGNHDRCMRDWLADRGDFQFAERRIHHGADGRKLLVTHGDQFDRSQQPRFSGAARLAAVMHESMLGGSNFANRILSELGADQRRFGTLLTTPFKRLAHAFSQFLPQARAAALDSGCIGTLCGHTHSPQLIEDGGFVYANTGDWLEHCSAVIETIDGQLELWQGTPKQWMNNVARRLSVSPAQPIAEKAVC